MVFTFIVGLAVCLFGSHVWLGRTLPFIGEPVSGAKKIAIQIGLSAVAILLLVLCLTGASAFFSDDLRAVVDQPSLFTLAVIVPVLETFLFNVLPMSLANRSPRLQSYSVAVLLQTFVFLAVHLVVLGPWAGLPVGLSAGLILALLYTQQLPSTARAFGITAATHGVYNATIFLLLSL